MLSFLPLPLEAIPREACAEIRGIFFPKEVRFRQLIVTGPPGAGKSTLIQQLRGWPEEGYIDLSYRGWWKTQAMNLRPREVHLGLPFQGQKMGLALFEEAWNQGWESLVLEEARIQIPPKKRFFWSVNWHTRFVFDFLLPDPEQILRRRRARAEQGTHPVDVALDLAQIRRQIQLFSQVADYFHRRGLRVLIRAAPDALPYRIASPSSDA